MDKEKGKDTKKIPSLLMKVKFINKGIELIKLENILNNNNISQTLPLSLKQEKPTIIYTYTNPIRNKIFNYADTIEEVNNFKHMSCSCQAYNSKFCNEKIGHIVTGDMSIITHKRLRTLFRYGPNYRVPVTIDWDKVLIEVKESVSNCIEKWSKKYHKDKKMFYEWKDTVLTHVRYKIDKLKNRYKPKIISKDKNMIDIFSDHEIKSNLKTIHKHFVVVGADKASNNVILICKKYYLSCIIKEFGIKLDDNKEMIEEKIKNTTYLKIDQTKDNIIHEHVTYMNKHHISIHDRMMMRLPNIYMIPKMHKTPPKGRYIAASNSCTTKPLSNIITKCLKLITLQHKKLCKAIYKYTQVNRMWIVDNSKDVLETIDFFNNSEKIKNINTYDFSTLYTNIPHQDLKEKITWVIEKAFTNKACIFVDDYNASWTKKRKDVYKFTKQELLKHIYYLIDNIYVTVGSNVFRQVVGIPMGTDCAPFLANLYLYALEYNFLEKLTKENIHEARKFSNCFRYIDDLIAFNNNNLMDKYKHKIYPKEMVLNKENTHDTNATFLDINLKIVNNILETSLYDKRDNFDFSINNFPILSGNIHFKRSHGIFISQLIRFSKVCMDKNDFIMRCKRMVNKLCQQFFNKDLLKQKFSSFYDKYYDLIKKYNVTKLKMMQDIFV